jgi:hypothetical protein
MRALLCSFALTAMLAPAAHAAGLTVNVEIPKLDVASYHRPYVALWIEQPDHKVAADLAVWYEQEKKDDEGTKWLKDLRQWWRRSGRNHSFPIDGVSGATRPVGSHVLTFEGDKAPLSELPPGDYGLVVEAARELGGRELLRIPFSWPPTQEQQSAAQGEHELGKVTLDLAP